jgi:hypothetical protein
MTAIPVKWPSTFRSLIVQVSPAYIRRRHRTRALDAKQASLRMPVNLKSDKIKVKGGRHAGMAIMIKVAAEDTIKARAEYMTVCIKRYTFNAMRAERAVSG